MQIIIIIFFLCVCVCDWEREIPFLTKLRIWESVWETQIAWTLTVLFSEIRGKASRILPRNVMLSFNLDTQPNKKQDVPV